MKALKVFLEAVLVGHGRSCAALALPEIQGWPVDHVQCLCPHLNCSIRGWLHLLRPCWHAAGMEWAAALQGVGPDCREGNPPALQGNPPAWQSSARFETSSSGKFTHTCVFS